MKKLVTLGLAVSMMSNISIAQKNDSSYHNWYYDVRVELYDKIHDKVDIAFIGNSITEKGEWHEMLPDKKIANRGIGGDNTFGILARLDGVIRQKPSKIFLMAGINDLGRGLSPQVIASNYQRIIQKLQTALPKTKIYVQSVLPLNDAVLKYDYLKNKNSKVTELNGLIRELAAKNHLVYIDLHPVMSNSNGELRKEFTMDGIHLNTEAYIAWVDFLKSKKIL